MTNSVFHKMVSILLISGLMLLLLTGCAKKEESAAAGSGGSGTIANFNPTGYPIVNEKITLRVAFNARAELPGDLNGQALSQKTEEVTNIHIDWIAIPSSGWTERKNLMLATGDLPDIFDAQLNADDLTRYGPDGTFIPMQDLIDKYAPNFTHLYEEMPALEALITELDGKGLGCCPQYSVMAYPDLLRKHIPNSENLMFLLALPFGYPDEKIRIITNPSGGSFGWAINPGTYAISAACTRFST